eukprot:3738946-Pleurochrysis_carterae.AAC.2
MMGQTVRVAGDGSCWLYALLATHGVIEHAISDLQAEPTDRDTFLMNKLNEAVNADEFVRNKTRAAVWRSGRCVHGGSWGGLDQFGAAAAVLETDIFCRPCGGVHEVAILHIQKWHVPWLSTVFHPRFL